MGFNLSFLFDQKELLKEGTEEILGWLRTGRIKPLPVKEYDFKNVAQAHRDMQSGKSIGRLALRMHAA